MKTKILLFLLLLSTKLVFSQSFYLGAMSGYGRSYIDNESCFKNLFDKFASNTYSLSFIASYKPKNPIISFNSGLSCKLFLLKDRTSFSFLKLPVGFDLQIGNKFQFLCGIGVFGQTFINKNVEQYYDYTKFQGGIYADLGFDYLINEKFSIFLKVLKDFDMTSFDSERTYNHMGMSSETESYFLYSTDINLGIRYCIKNKK